MMQILTTVNDFEHMHELFIKEKPLCVAMDTEFHRQTTFYPELSLVQITWGDHCFIMDALSHAWHKKYLHPLVCNHSLTLIMHAARQDLEIIFQMYKALPPLVFDTQIAATFLGFKDHCSYGALVEHYMQITLDKSQQHTEWMHRPLSYDQLTYAAHDVVHLFDLYPLMVNDLKQQNRFEWALEEMKSLSCLRFDEPIHSSRLARMGISKKNYFLAHALFMWRDEQARSLNYNRGRILNDKHLVILTSFRDLEKVRDYCLRHHILEDHGLLSMFLEYFEGRLTQDQGDMEEYMMASPLSVNEKEKMHKLKGYRDKKAEDLNLPPSFLASTEDMKQWISVGQGRLATTWRHDIFKNAL